MMKKGLWVKLLLSGLLAAALVLSGCSGDDGDQGPAGPAGPPGPPGTGVTQASETCSICHAVDRIADVAEFHGLNATIGTIAVTGITPTITVDGAGIVTAAVTFNFAATDALGNPVAVNLKTATTSLSYIRFSLAKLVPGVAGDPDTWYDYVNGQRVPAQLVDNGGGSYTYTFTPFSATVSALYDPTTTHRLAMQVSGLTAFGLPAANPVYDFVPNGSPVTLTRDIVRIEACNQCHDPLAFHGGGRIDTKFCVVCHNPTLAVTTTGLAEGDLGYMVHKIHAAGDFTVLDNAISYAEVTYPQDLRNCAKCHTGTQGANWKTVPNQASCSSCHTTIDFATHQGGQADNSACASCHTAAAIEVAHVTDNATPNNPTVPAGAVNFTYELSSVTANASNQPVVVFRILADGAPVTFGAAGTTLLTGFTGSPSFLVAYAQAQDGIAAPVDFNNRGKAAGQPASISITSLWDGTNGTLTGPDASGYYTATLTSAAAAFPAGSTLRTIGLQGYFTQVTPAVARHTQSVVMTVTGDTARRAIVKSSGCAECHEIFEGHGGNRVLTAAGGVEICTLCHNPNLSSSGRGANPATLPAAIVTALGSDPLTYPEATNNFKDMIHGIHSAKSIVRTKDYEFVRDRSGGLYYNWTEVTYPGEINNCEKCHIGTSYRPENIPAGALLTTNVTTNGTSPMSRTAVQASRASVPNATDEVITAKAATCYSCHTAESVVDHMKLNGGGFGTRSNLTQ